MNNNLRLIRGNRSRKEVAAFIGISSAHLGYLERGERKPSIGTALKLADYYKTRIEYLFPANS